MKLKKTDFKDLLIIEPEVFNDHRGCFFESFNQENFFTKNIYFAPVQDNESFSKKGVIRGLHYQLKPYAQAKLVRVISGEILDIALDLRKKSPTFGRYFSLIISSENKFQLLIPRGFAHGFSVLSNNATVNYKCDNFYSPELERGIKYDDPELKIDWNVEAGSEIVSEKDLQSPLFSNAEMNFSL